MKIRDRIKELRRVKASDLAPNPRNWRTHPEAQVDAMRGILAEVGYAGAALARETPDGLQLIDGHLRAELTPDAKIPVLVLDVTEEEADKILATFDPVGKMAEADEQKLGELLVSIETESEAVQAMLAELADAEGLDVFQPDVPEEPPEAQVDRAAELQEKWGTKLGQLWVIGEHRLLCGDSTKAEVPSDVDTVVSDPPYGIDFDTNYKRFTTGFDVARQNHDRIPNDDKPFDPSPYLQYPHVVLWGACFYPNALPLGSWLVWDKRFANGTAFLSDAELAWMKGGYGIYIFSETSQGCVRPERVQHPTQKPVSLLRWCIEKVRGEGMILDPFLGSGTTMVAAQQLNRRCYGIEISPAYCAVVLQRMKDLTGETPVLET